MTATFTHLRILALMLPTPVGSLFVLFTHLYVLCIVREVPVLQMCFFDVRDLKRVKRSQGISFQYLIIESDSFCFFAEILVNSLLVQQNVLSHGKAETFYIALKVLFSSDTQKCIKRICLSTSGYIFRFTFRSLCNVSYSDECQTKTALSVRERMFLLFRVIVKKSYLHCISGWFHACISHSTNFLAGCLLLYSIAHFSSPLPHDAPFSLIHFSLIRFL